MNSFNPVKYSTEENQFLLENVGATPIVVMNKPMPPAVNPRAIRPVLQEVYDREQLKQQSGIEWAGVEALKTSILKYLEVDAKWAEDWRRTRGKIPRLPSMSTRDGKGRYHLGASGSDSDYPRTWEDAEGNRIPFEIDLDGWGDYDPAVAPSKPAPKSLINDAEKNRIECPICAHTESYRGDSKSSENAARARMSKHLKSATQEASLHRELYSNEFGS